MTLILSRLPLLDRDPHQMFMMMWSVTPQNTWDEPTNTRWGKLLDAVEKLPLVEIEHAGLSMLEEEPGVIDRLRNSATEIHQMITAEDAPPEWAKRNLRAHRTSVSAVVAKLIERREFRSPPVWP